MVPMAVTVLQSQLRTCEAVVSKNALSFLGGERERAGTRASGRGAGKGERYITTHFSNWASSVNHEQAVGRMRQCTHNSNKGQLSVRMALTYVRLGLSISYRRICTKHKRSDTKRDATSAFVVGTRASRRHVAPACTLDPDSDPAPTVEGVWHVYNVQRSCRSYGARSSSLTCRH